MKILLLGDASSIHIYKWANSLMDKGILVTIFTFASPICNYDSKIVIINNGFDLENTNRNTPVFNKFLYLKTIFKLRRVIKQFKPDILHAHYATSYGLLGSLSLFSPFIISVWGSDVFDFPKHSFFHTAILKFNFLRSNLVLSTSYVMAEEIKKYTSKRVIVTPFGIDSQKFRKDNFHNKNEKQITIGTIKTLAPIYGINYLIEAFSILKIKRPNFNLKLVIVGDGPIREDLMRFAKEKSVSEQTTFIGKIIHDKVPEYLNSFDIFIALSIEESFGVAIIEASACQLPVIVSNVGGLPEVVLNGESGFLVRSKDAEDAAEKMILLVDDIKLREKMGRKGREFVIQNYNWDNSVSQMIKIYDEILKLR
jgi:glycosyltransferase involved in cell wall biosynthesis